jgi:hypothetical protein
VNFDSEKTSNQSLRKIFKKITITTLDNGEKEITPTWNSGLDKSFEEIRKEFMSKYSLRAD